jgi:hypothetical protein
MRFCVHFYDRLTFFFFFFFFFFLFLSLRLGLGTVVIFGAACLV